MLDVPEFLPLIGKTVDIPFSLLDTNASTRVKASQSDNAEVDLSQWAEPDKTPRVPNAQYVLHRFAVKWWMNYQEGIVTKLLESRSQT